MPRFLQKLSGPLVYAAIIVVAITTGRLIENSTLAAERLAQRNRLHDVAELLTERLESKINSHKMIAIALSSAIARNPTLTQDKFSAIVAPLVAGQVGILNVTAAPDLVVRYVYPLEKNRSILGQTYLKVFGQIAAVNMVRKNRNLLYSGPIALGQGGSGLIGRSPVFIRTANSGQLKFWGVVSVLMNRDALFGTPRFIHAGNILRIGVKMAGGPDGNSQKIWGDQSVFAENPVSLNFIAGSNTWEIGVVPKTGWLVTSRQRGVIWLIVLASAALMAINAGVFRHIRKARAAARRQLAIAVHSMNDGFAMFDANDRLVMFNDTYKSCYGAAADAVIKGASFESMIRNVVESGRISPAMGSQEAWISKRVAGHKMGCNRVDIRLSDDCWLMASDSKTPDGGTVSILADITALKLAKQQADIANRTKTDFLNMVSHELRTPLTAILGFAAFLNRVEKFPGYKRMIKARDAAGPDNVALNGAMERFVDDIKKYGERIDVSGHHLLELINDILDWSGFDAASISFDPVPVKIADLVSDIVGQFSSVVQEKALILTGEAGDEIVMGDLLRLRQAMIHLVGNAVKFTASGKIEIWTQTSGDTVSIHVRDTGCGIRSGAIKTIFEQFRQVDNSITRAHSGAGLGLAIARGIVEMHSGKITVTSECNKGSTFVILLPIARQDTRDGGRRRATS